ncbi:hypothetical protein EXM22_15385 [Oceanispirochaeta crateris]|uniref:DUF6259 domain-containing protein n=1 Tax=Oceanispirochaeta crateris TaxID=2518645 RepID=A0A5C1QTE8_9SPIO|nr:DUF6259 domain-containing protein [Oceanispirochaeta crateris]QEN09292.1 hypothetical protein EXM22_15385 [Oceanispirochaeta crateris]
MSSESIIYNSDDLSCSLHLDGPLETTKTGPLYVFRILSGSQTSILKLDIEIKNKDSAWFWWPNHEGERGILSQVHGRLEDLDEASRGISVLYPISASCRTIILGDGQGGVILSAMPDEKGRISQISVKSKSSQKVEFFVKTGRSCWILTQYQGGPEEALLWMSRIIEKVKWPVLERAEPVGKFLLQVGLIGPDYDCLVPVERGFMVLEDIARVMKHQLGTGHWLHVFGYAHGHDLLYPDYNPSGFLGGPETLKRAIRAVHRKGQKVSFYLNLRIADESLVENDFELKKAVFLDRMGKPVLERSNDRSFLVMNPESPIWQDRIVKEAERLISLGADGLELNYSGQQALLVSLGEQWGDGIRKMITRIKNLGVKIWYRGGTDIYPADWWEMSSEEERIDTEGHVLSGSMIGEFDPRLLMTLAPGRSYLVPLSRESFPLTEEALVMKDLEDIMGGLFIYDEEYLERIEMILKRAAEESQQEDMQTQEEDTQASDRVERQEKIPEAGDFPGNLES